ncbi:MAG: DNA-deoxyinosine glycosylase [Gemmiger sp.]|nr:DNA-deoxyinosine glycosylase [Gemmiger sp.]
MAEPQAVGPGLPPLCGPGCRVLILGSFPSPKSRAQGFYYGHPQNRFWPLMAALTGNPTPAWQDIAAKRAILLQNGVALWDTIARCTILGASDASIRDVVPNKVPDLVQQWGIEAVFCNGAASGRLYARYLQAETGIAAGVLPSTSPANAAWGLPRLEQAWGQALAPWLPTR